jgi:hypothetical protein
MKIKTNELTGAALDWAVAICEHNVGWGPEGEDRDYYSTDWAQGGPIIEREGIGFGFGVGIDSDQWEAGYTTPEETGPTPLIAAMRCYVASKLGDEIDVPEELCPPTA